MRVTNQMSTSRMLMNINRNMKTLDKYFEQYASRKKIQYASDDPIIASRALRFRRNVAQTEQYQRNVSQAKSWMSISSSGIGNAESIMSSIRESLVEGTSDPRQLPDREKILAEVNSLFQQIGDEMNISFGGRYVFSGYRTDEPPVITRDQDVLYRITQSFSLNDIESTKGFVKFNDPTLSPDEDPYMPQVTDINRIKLPYHEGFVENSLTSLSLLDGNGRVIDTINVNEVDMNDPAQKAKAYAPNDDEINFIKETGELIIGKDALSKMQHGTTKSISVTYEKEGVKKGDLNPLVYFDTWAKTGEKVAGSEIIDPKNIKATHMTIGDGAGGYKELTDVNVFTLKNKNIHIEDLGAAFSGISPMPTITKKSVTEADRYEPGADEVFYIEETGELVFGDTVKTNVENADEVKIQYELDGKYYTMDNQDFRLEFGINNRMSINNLAKDMFTPQMYADIQSIILLAENTKLTSDSELKNYYASQGLEGEELTQAVEEHKMREEQEYRTLLHENFNNLLGLVDTHESKLSTEFTHLGTKMNRLDFIEARLEDDVVSYKTLQSENEDVNYLDVIMNLQQANAVYTASLRAGAQIMQISLADFI